MKPPSKHLDTLGELVLYARDRGGPHCFAGWSPEILRGYLAFHSRQGTLLFVRHPAPACDAIEALAVGWQCQESDLAAFAPSAPPNRDHAFHWQPTNPAGDAFLFAEVVVSARRAFAPLIAEYQWRLPQWRTLKTFTFRRGKLVRYPQPEKLFTRFEHHAL